MEDGQQHYNAMSDDHESSSFYDKKQESEQPGIAPVDQDHLKPKTKSKKKHINKKKEKLAKTSKKPHTTKEKEKEMKLYHMAEKRVNEIMARMKYYYEKDLELQEKKKLACQKLSYLEDLSKQLKNVYVCEKFIQRDGMTLFQRWLEKVSIDGQSVEPGVSLRKGVLEILYGLNFSPENISKTNDIQRLVGRQKRSQVKQLRDLSEQIILKWNKIAYEAE